MCFFPSNVIVDHQSMIAVTQRDVLTVSEDPLQDGGPEKREGKFQRSDLSAL
jgi:hypothetical protein